MAEGKKKRGRPPKETKVLEENVKDVQQVNPSIERDAGAGNSGDISGGGSAPAGPSGS